MWTFQWYLLRNKQQFAVTWVKAKYYQNFWCGLFIEYKQCSLGFQRLCICCFKDALCSPNSKEYRFIRNLPDGRLDVNEETCWKQHQMPSILARPTQRCNSCNGFNALSEEVVNLNQKPRFGSPHTGLPSRNSAEDYWRTHRHCTNDQRTI